MGYHRRVMKIAYLTNYQNRYLYDSKNLFSYISDRRRVVGWAQDRGHRLITNPEDTVDAAVFGVLSDFRQLDRFRNKWKVLDMVDGYLNLEENLFIDSLRGLRRDDWTFKTIKFSKRLQHACKTVDCIVVGSPEQAESVQKFNKNIHVILDDQSEFGAPKTFKDHSDKGERIILWEGLSASLPHLLSISRSLDSYLKTSNSTLLVLSNKRTKISKFSSRTKDTKELLRDSFSMSKNQVYFFPWSSQSVIENSMIADMAIIPLDMEDKLALLKPENKLLIMLSLGLKTLVSPINSYSRVCQELSLEHFLVDKNNWFKKLDEIDHFYNTSLNETGIHRYLETSLSKEKLFLSWDKAFGV